MNDKICRTQYDIFGELEVNIANITRKTDFFDHVQKSLFFYNKPTK